MTWLPTPPRVLPGGHKVPGVEVECDTCDTKQWIPRLIVDQGEADIARRLTARGWSTGDLGDFCPGCVAESARPEELIWPAAVS